MSDNAIQKDSVRFLACINIVSSNPKRLADFYKNVLGADICEEHGGPHRIEIRFGDKSTSTCIVVNYQKDFVLQNLNACHGFEFRVADADSEYERIRNLGIELKEPPQNLPWGYRFFHIEDPDGNGVDIVAQL